MKLNLQMFVLIIGNARSGSTLLGSVLDAHPNATVANETIDSANLWRGLTGREIVQNILKNAEAQAISGRPSSGYLYQISIPPRAKHQINVVGDKVWNPATLLLHGDYNLLPSLEDRLGIPVMLLHSIRNPYDVVATMHMRSGAPVSDRIKWYRAHCESVAAIEERIPGDRLIHVHHEELVRRPAEIIRSCCERLHLEIHDQHIGHCRKILFTEPRLTRDQVEWQATDIGSVQDMIHAFHWLDVYDGSNPVCAKPAKRDTCDD